MSNPGGWLSEANGTRNNMCEKKYAEGWWGLGMSKIKWPKEKKKQGGVV